MCWSPGAWLDHSGNRGGCRNRAHIDIPAGVEAQLARAACNYDPRVYMEQQKSHRTS
jgi:hypothetical protein